MGSKTGDTRKRLRKLCQGGQELKKLWQMYSWDRWPSRFKKVNLAKNPNNSASAAASCQLPAARSPLRGEGRALPTQAMQQSRGGPGVTPG